MKNVDVSKYFKPDLKKARKRSSNNPEQIEFDSSNEFEKIGLNKTYFIQTFGCQGNEADSEMIAGILENLGYEKSDVMDESDFIVLNTCAIRENAEIRVWGIVGRLKGIKIKNPNLILVLAGCMSQEENVVEKALKTYQHIDIVLGTHNIHKLSEYIKTAIFSKERVIEVYSEEGNIVENLPKVRNHKYKAWVNIMFGCDEFCTYCIVPYTRGKERSRNKTEIINEVKELVDSGYLEVTLLGQNVNAYGKDLKDLNYTFGDLLNDLEETGIKRIRFVTSHPHDLDEKTMYAIKNSKSVMPFFHLPVQSGSNQILRKMNRHYTKESYLEVLKKLKSIVPNISVTTDIIVGFPNETDDDFLETMDLVEKADFEGAYTYIFSKREGTPAYNFEDNISYEVKKHRLAILNKKINELYLKHNKEFIGKKVKVLVEGFSKKNENILSGYSENNKLVNFVGKEDMIGKITDVEITNAKTWFLLGVASDE